MTAKKLILATLTVGALGLAACTGPGKTASETPAPAPSSQATQAPESTASAAPSPDAPSESAEAPMESTPAPDGDFPYEEGPVDAADFAKRYGAAMMSVKTMTIETTNSTGQGNSTGVLDISDKSKPRSHFITDLSGAKMELVTIDGKSWMRTDGGPWEESGTDGSADDFSQYENAEKVFKKVTLVSRAERKFEVEMDISTDGQMVPATMWVDEQFRTVKQEIEMQGVSSTTTYSKYDEPVEIPEVG